MPDLSDITIRVLINDQQAYCTPEDLAAGRPTILDGLNFQWGRETIVDQPDPGSASFTVRQQVNRTTGPAALFTVLHAGARVQIHSMAGTRDVLCWVGEITAVTVTQVADHAIQADVTCIDTSALLANITIGDQPWPQQDAYSRFTAILNAAGLKIKNLSPPPGTGWDYTLTGQMDPALQPLIIAARDVDAQPPLDLLHSLATSVGGVCWLTADSSGPYLWVEDPVQREGLRQFVIDPGTGQVTIADIAFTDPDNPDLWTANDIVRDPVTWTQDPAQAITSVDVQWLQPGTDDEGLPTSTEQTVTQSDQSGIAVYGIRSLGIDTELATLNDASNLAFNWLMWSRSAEWVVTGLSLDTALLQRPSPNPGISDTHRLTVIMDLLDIRLRIGYRLSIEDLPVWSPVGTRQSYYLDGGTYTWEDRRWRFELVGTANAIGGQAIYEEFPDGQTTWEDWEPSITWIDCYGVAAPDLTTLTEPAAMPEMQKVGA